MAGRTNQDEASRARGSRLLSRPFISRMAALGAASLLILFALQACGGEDEADPTTAPAVSTTAPADGDATEEVEASPAASPATGSSSSASPVASPRSGSAASPVTSSTADDATPVDTDLGTPEAEEDGTPTS